MGKGKILGKERAPLGFEQLGHGDTRGGSTDDGTIESDVCGWKEQKRRKLLDVLNRIQNMIQAPSKQDGHWICCRH